MGNKKALLYFAVIFNLILGIQTGVALAQSSIYPVTVNYDLSLAEMIKAGQYDWANNDITSKNFPTTRMGKVEVVVELIHFNKAISTKDALKELDRQGYRPAEPNELLAFGRKYPDVQREFPVVALGSVWQGRDDDRDIPYLYGNGSRRYLSLRWVGLGWSGIYRFAAVRK